ncbi:hypothetical protein VNI00_005575 [Paramarasmius palmivorus]|uniref:Uncharacterized protein n=1 Tax=Paramarasmius palmivorus TaxID=297713 RepID=A0AAW0DEK6_9AGAR
MCNPLWVIQTSQAVQTMDSSPHQKTVTKLGFIQAIHKVMEKSGIQGFWRGIGPALILTVNPVIQYTVFEQLKNFLVKKRTARLRAAGLVAAVVLSDFDFFILGAISKLVATLTTYPYIVVKSRLQAGHVKYKSSVDGLKTIIKEEGFGGLYKGAGSKLTQSVLTAAFLFAAQRRIYEITKAAVTIASK